MFSDLVPLSAGFWINLQQLVAVEEVRGEYGLLVRAWVQGVTRPFELAGPAATGLLAKLRDKDAQNPLNRS